MKNIRVFYLKIIQFLEVKFSIYLNRRVFVMLLLGYDGIAEARDIFSSKQYFPSIFVRKR